MAVELWKIARKLSTIVEQKFCNLGSLWFSGLFPLGLSTGQSPDGQAEKQAKNVTS